MGRGFDGLFESPFVFTAGGAVFKPAGAAVSTDFGGHSEGETPLPIPNRAVKPLSADGTWPSRAWESRSPPINLTGRPGGRPVCVGPVFVPDRRPVCAGSARGRAGARLRWTVVRRRRAWRPRPLDGRPSAPRMAAPHGACLEVAFMRRPLDWLRCPR